jgi:DnaJ-class molecular chaperone
VARRKFKVCPKCDGRGRVYKESGAVAGLAKDGLARTGSPESEKCPKCGGLGKVARKEESNA